MSKEEMRSIRREYINWYIQKLPYPLSLRMDNPFFLRDIKSMVRNGEVFRYGRELKAYADV